MEELSEPEREIIDQLCRVYGLAAVNRFWWTLGSDSRPASIYHHASAQSVPASRAVLQSLEHKLIVHLFPGSGFDQDAAQFELTDRGFQLCPW